MHARCCHPSADPLCWHGATRARVANEYLLATERGLKEMSDYTFPFTVFHGADDTLTDPDGSRALYERSQVGALHVLARCSVKACADSAHRAPSSGADRRGACCTLDHALTFPVIQSIPYSQHDMHSCCMAACWHGCF